MKLNELKQERANKIEKMDALINAANSEKRELSKEDNEKWENLRSEVDQIDNKVNMLEKQEELNRSIVTNEPAIEKNNAKKDSKRALDQVISEHMRNGAIDNFTITTRDQTTSTASGAISVDTQGLSVIGKDSMEAKLKSLGFKYLSNLQNDVKLPYQSPIVASGVSEGYGYSNPESLGSVTLSAGRYSVNDTFSIELLRSGNEAVLAELIDDMMKGCERALEADIYTTAAADATAVSAVTAMTFSNLQAIEKALDADGVWLMPRSNFFTAKQLTVDSGSGIFYFKKNDNNTALSYEGTPALFSNLFSGDQVVYTEPSSIVIGSWGEKYEITFDVFSQATKGEVVITVAKVANVISRNTGGSVKSSL